jgi:ribosomal protein S18 acetylase RimI-like enzyme
MQQPIVIRPALLNDVNTLLSIELACFDYDACSKRSFRHFIKQPHITILVAEIAGQILGYAVMLLRKNSSRARLYSIAVQPEWHGQGLAKKLLAALESRLYLLPHISSIYLEVHQSNLKALAFYQLRGYQIFGEYHCYYDDGASAWRMLKPLQALAPTIKTLPIRAPEPLPALHYFMPVNSPSSLQITA